MGREIRRVPADWEHPKVKKFDYRTMREVEILQPLFDRCFEEPTHYQVYETVSEGTPVTPHFATKAELIDYLVEHGDAWDELRTKEGRQASAGWNRDAATDFVEREWAPSMIITGGTIYTPKDGMPK